MPLSLSPIELLGKKILITLFHIATITIISPGMGILYTATVSTEYTIYLRSLKIKIHIWRVKVVKDRLLWEIDSFQLMHYSIGTFLKDRYSICEKLDIYCRPRTIAIHEYIYIYIWIIVICLFEKVIIQQSQSLPPKIKRAQETMVQQGIYT